MPCQDKTQRFNLWTWQGMIGSGVHKQENELKRWETGSTEQNFQKTMKFIIFFVFFAGILGFARKSTRINKPHTDRTGISSGLNDFVYKATSEANRKKERNASKLQLTITQAIYSEITIYQFLHDLQTVFYNIPNAIETIASLKSNLS